MRLAVVTVLASACAALAFAPAPLPRRDRREAQDDLAAMQGVWQRLTHNGRDAPGDTVEVKGDVWRANVPGDSWTLKFDQKARPRRVDLRRVGEPTNFFLGVYELQGDTFTYSLSQYATEDQRPLDFAANRPWVSVFRRVR